MLSSSSSSSSSFQLDIFIVLERNVILTEEVKIAQNYIAKDFFLIPFPFLFHSLFFLSLESYTQKFFLSLLFFLALNGSVGSRADSRTEK